MPRLRVHSFAVSVDGFGAGPDQGLENPRGVRGGAPPAWALRPAIFVIGKSIGGGVPSGAYGLTTDLAIQGDSFFVVKKGTQNYYTRSGNFELDADGIFAGVASVGRKGDRITVEERQVGSRRQERRRAHAGAPPGSDVPVAERREEAEGSPARAGEVVLPVDEDDGKARDGGIDRREAGRGDGNAPWRPERNEDAVEAEGAGLAPGPEAPERDLLVRERVGQVTRQEGVGGRVAVGLPPAELESPRLDVDRRRDAPGEPRPVSYTHLRAHETVLDLVCRLLLDKKNHTQYSKISI